MQDVILTLVVAGSIIYAANMHQINNDRSKLINAFLLILAIGGILLGGAVAIPAIGSSLNTANTADVNQTDLPKIDVAVAIGYMVLSFVLGILSITVIVSRKVRVWIARYVIRSDKHNRRYHPDSIVHTTAIVIAFFQILNIVGGFILAGGIEGLAEEFAASGLSFDLLFGSLLTNLLVALLGVGLFLRRDISHTLERLGLNQIKPTSLLVGVSVGFIIFWAGFGLSLVWSLLVSPETLAEQSSASEQLFLIFGGSFLGGFMLAATAAIGEEILFRGALQPIFGIFWTSVFFALLHTQYTLTPAALIIFGVSLILGWVRQRYGTSAAIVAHFVYNFVPFVLFWTFGQVVLESAIR
jgi:membrane protease YdiL (CAAX protease family)